MLSNEEITYVFIKYMKQTIINQANKYYKKKMEDRTLEYDENNYKNADEQNNIFFWSITEKPDSIFEKKSDLLDFIKLFHQLNDQEKEFLLEKYLNKKSDAEIGKVFSVSSQAISKRKRKLLAKLKQHLDLK